MEGCVGFCICIGNKQETFDAEIFSIMRATHFFDSKRQDFMISTDSQASTNKATDDPMAGRTQRSHSNKTVAQKAGNEQTADMKRISVSFLKRSIGNQVYAQDKDNSPNRREDRSEPHLCNTSSVATLSASRAPKKNGSGGGDGVGRTS